VTAFAYVEYTLICDYDGCKAHYGPFNVERTRAHLRRLATRDGWTHVHEQGAPRSQDTDYCPDHKPEGEQ